MSGYDCCWNERERELGKTRTAEQKKFKTLFFLFLSFEFYLSMENLSRVCFARGLLNFEVFEEVPNRILLKKRF